MRIPDVVVIGAAEWDVELVDALPSKEGPECDDFGLTIFSTESIKVARSANGRPVSENCMADTFLHEIIHGVSNTYGLGLTENQVSGLAGGLLALFRSNDLDFSDRGDGMACKGSGKGKKKGK